MKKIIITLAPGKMMMNTMSLALFTCMINGVLTETMVSKQLRESFAISLN